MSQPDSPSVPPPQPQVRADASAPLFTGEQKLVIALLTFIQFLVVLDFMVLAPLGAQLMPTLGITPKQFGLAVSAYAFAAGLGGVAAAGFADRFDRKRWLLFFFAGFIAGTVACALAPGYHSLVAARTLTGLFGGVLSSATYTLVTDLFPFQVRGRVMGWIQTAFAGSQVLGLPTGLFLAAHGDWHAPFALVAGLGVPLWAVIAWKLKPVRGHLSEPGVRRMNPFLHLFKTVARRDYLVGFTATTLLATGGFMLMPFSSAFCVHNLGVALDELPLVYLVTGLVTMVSSPLVGKLADRVGKYAVFAVGSIAGMLLVWIYTNLPPSPLWVVIAVTVVLFVVVSSRMVSSQALLTSVPEPADRGAFLSLNASLAQMSGGIAAIVAGFIVIERPDGGIDRYDILGYVVMGAMLITLLQMGILNRSIRKRTQ